MGIPWETVQFTAFGQSRVLFYDMLEEGTGTQPCCPCNCDQG